MDGQQQNFYLDNLNLDSDEMNWDRAGQKNTLNATAPSPNPTTWNTTPERDPRSLGNRVSAFPDSAFGTSASPSAEPIPRTQDLQPEILAPAPIVSPEPLNPALITSPETPETDKPEATPISAPTMAPDLAAKPHESAEEFARTAEVELAQDGNIAGFYDKIRNYGDTK